MMDTETPTVITSLTSTSQGGSRKNNTTSLAEALATTVADFICEGGGGSVSSALRKNGELFSNPLNSPSSAMAPLNSDLPSNNAGSGRNNVPPPSPRTASATVVSENNNYSQENTNGSNTSASSTITMTSNSSSMGSTIADLASICNFRQQSSSSSAPIISGTAAEVLALQNAIRDYSTTKTTAAAIVSNPSSVESPNSPSTSTSPSCSLARNASDGAPMISGTAAAQLAISTAAKTSNNGAHYGAAGTNNNNNRASFHQHAVTSGDGLDVDAVASLKGDNYGAGLRETSPVDFSSSTINSTAIENALSSSHSQLNQSIPLHINNATTKGGSRGMEILAEITCHAPPMPLLQRQQQQTPSISADSIPSYQQIYHQVKHRVSAIPSYQEIYWEMGQQQQSPPSSLAAHHQHQGYLVESVDDISNAAQHHSTSSHFGHPLSKDGDMIEEGKELYTRKDLVTYGGHLCENKDFHGNMKDGCDSIIIANLVSLSNL